MARSYTQQTIKLLFGQARSCAFPSCDVPLVLVDRNQRTVVAEIAHIRSESPDGPRHDPSYAGDVNGPANLLLLCGVHHKPVDRYESICPIAELEAWKAAQVASAAGGTRVTEEEGLAILRITPEERQAIDKIIRLAYRLELAAQNASDALRAVSYQRKRAMEQLVAQMGPIMQVDDDGNRTLITNFQMPLHQENEFARRYQETLQQQRPLVREVATQLGEEVAVLRMMDALLGALANQAVLTAQLVPDVLHDPSVLEQCVNSIQRQVSNLCEAARERY